jgi:AcrR family transcriptional regulator
VNLQPDERDRCRTVATAGRLSNIDGPRKKPRQRRSRETVAVLLEAAAQVFTREGFAATTNRIAERAGVSIGTLYQYFPNKESLLYALAERHVAEAGSRLSEVFDRLRRDTPPFDDTMRAILEVVVDVHRGHPGLHRVMHRLALRSSADLDVLRALEDHIAEEVGFHLKRCDRGGDDVELTAQTIVAAVDAHVHRVMTRRGFGAGASGATGRGDAGDDVEQLFAMVSSLAAPPR